MKIEFKKSKAVGLAIFFIFISIIGAYMAYEFSVNVILTEGDVPLEPGLQKFMAIAFGIIAAGALMSGLSFIVYLLSDRGSMTFTEEGVENTFIPFNIFALYLVIPVRKIPWSCLNSAEKNDRRGVTSRINKEKISEIEAGPFAKFLLKISGFGFGYGLSQPNPDEIIAFIEEYRR